MNIKTKRKGLMILIYIKGNFFGMYPDSTPYLKVITEMRKAF
jgi:hypothetical protein